MEQDQNTTPPVQPAQENAFPSADEKTGPSNYALIGGLIGLGIIALGAWYMMMGDKTPTDVAGTPVAPEIVVTPPPTTTTQGTEQTTDSATAAMKTQGTSDEIAAIEADLQATDMNGFNDISKI